MAVHKFDDAGEGVIFNNSIWIKQQHILPFRNFNALVVGF